MRILVALLLAISLTSVAQDYPNKIVPQLSTKAALDDSEVFTSPWVELFHYDSIIIGPAADQDFSYNVLFSTDCTNADSTLPRKFEVGRLAAPERLTIGRSCVKVVVTNDSGEDMTWLRFQVMAGDKTPLNFPLDGVLPHGADAHAVRNDDYKIDIALGRRDGLMNERKYGYNDDVDTASEETVWAVGGRWEPLDAGETLDISSSSANDSAAGTGARTIQIAGVNASGVSITEDVTLNGTSTVVSVNSWLAVNRVIVTSAGSGKVNAGNVSLDATTAGTPQGYVPAGKGTTQQAIFTTGSTSKAVVDGLLWNVRKLSGGGGAPRVTIYAYYHNRSAGTISQIFRVDIDAEAENTFMLEPTNPFVISEGDSLEITADTDINNTVVNVNFWATEIENP